MKRTITTILAIISFYSCLLAENYVYVINNLSETLSRINIETGAVENHIVTLGVIPNQVVYYEDMLYVVNSGNASLQVINPVNNSIVNEFPLPAGSNPWHAAYHDNYAFVAGFASSSVYKVNLSSGSIVATYSVGQCPAGIIEYNGRLYAANTGFNPVDFSYGQGSVTIIDIGDGSIIDQVNIGKNPQAMAVGPDGVINIICTGDYMVNMGMIYFLDPSDNSIIDSISTGGNPYMPVINLSGIGFISAGGWINNGHVYSYDAISRTVLRGDDNPVLVGTGSIGLALDSTGMLYSAGQLANLVTKFNCQGTVLEDYPVGSGPLSLTIIDSRTSTDESNDIVPVRISLDSPYPNPFNSKVILSLNGNYYGSGKIIIDIFDSNGRQVNRLNMVGNQSINNNIIWSGVDYYGNDVASGVYFARIKGTSKAVKMVLLR